MCSKTVNDDTENEQLMNQTYECDNLIP